MSKINYLYELPNGVKRSAVADFLVNHWGSENIVSKGKITNASDLPKIIAYSNNKIVGLVTYAPDLGSKSCEVISIDTVIQGKGLGTILLKLVEGNLKKIGIKKIWLITTNDNMEAVNFYLKNGFRLVKVNLNALDKSRKLKPEIPKLGSHNIPLLHELEFEKEI